MSAHTFPMPERWQTDPDRVSRFCVVQGTRQIIYEPLPCLTCHGHVRAADEDEVYTDDDLLGLVHYCLDHKCASIWLCPPHAVDWLASARALLEDTPDWLRVHPLTTKQGALAGLVCQRERGGVPMGVYIVDSGDVWNIAGRVGDLAPEEIAKGLHTAACLLGMQLRFTPSYTGLQMLRQELAGKRADIPPLSEQVRDLVMAHLPTYVQWSRPFSDSLMEWNEAEPGMRGIWKYDRNSSFIASAGNVPVGQPVATDRYAPGFPGLYQVVWAADSPPAYLPGPFHMGDGAGYYPSWGEAWAWEPQLRLANAHGLTFSVRQGFYWPEQHDLFRTWRERLWRARQEAEAMGGGAGRIAGAIVKRAGVAAVGRLKQIRAHAVMTLDQAEEEGRRILHRDIDEQGEFTGLAEVVAALGKTDLWRPDWWATIISSANERLFSAIYAHADALPVAAYVDAVYCLRPWPSGDAELASHRLGKWKLERRIPLLEEDAIAELNTLSAAAWVKKLAAIARDRAQPDMELDDGEGEEAE